MDHFLQELHELLIEGLETLQGGVGQVFKDGEEIHGVPRGGSIYEAMAVLYKAEHLPTAVEELLTKAHGTNDFGH